MKSRTWKSRAELVFSICTLCSGSLSVSSSEAQARFKIDLKPDLVISEATGVAFGGGLHLAVDSKGRIYVGDSMNRSVRVFGPEGEPLETIGRSGQGPGEFTAIHQVTVGRGDSLYVFDASAFRLTVYAPDLQTRPAYTLRVPSADGLGYPYRIFIPADPALPFLAAFRDQAQGTVRVHRLSAQGEVGKLPLLQGKASESRVAAGRSTNGVAVTRTTGLFSRAALVGLTPQDELYYGWSEKIDLTFHDLTGKKTRVFRADIRPVPVTARDIEHELQGASKERRQALQGTEPPATKPALKAVLVDDRSWIWTGRHTGDPTTTRWWVTRDRGRGASAIFDFPDSVSIRLVRDGRAYGVSTDDLGRLSVLRYLIRTEGAQKQ